MDKAFSVIIPTYKEYENVAPLVERIHQALPGHKYQVLFIDDNSGDGTEELVSRLAGKYPVRIVVRRDKRGLASAVIDGLRYADGEIVAVMDADLQHPPELLPLLLEGLNGGADMAIASRYVKGGSCQGWGLVRRIISKGAIAIAHVLLPPTRQIKDPMSGYFMFRKGTLDGADLKPYGYKILLEMLAGGNFGTVVEVPYTFDTRSRGESKLKAKTQIDYLKHVYSLMKRTGELARFLKFALVGLSGVGVNLGFLWLLTEKAGIYDRLSSAIAIEISIITNFLFNNFFTFKDRRSSETRSTLQRLLKFNAVCLAGAGINWGLFVLFSNLGVYYILAQLIGIAAATLWNYVLSTVWTWK